jgi:DNA-binding NarL/FixJ family response regulator
MIRVLIVDDHSVFRSAARELLEAVGYDVVGEAEDAAQGVSEARRLEPDALLLDVQLPDLDGFAVARQLAADPHAPRIVMVSSREASDYGSQLLRSPAVGFIHKPELSRDRLVALIGPPEGQADG